MKNLSIAHKLLAGAIAVTLVIVTWSALTLWVNSETRKSVNAATLNWDRTVTLREIQMYQLDVQALVRGVIITQNGYLRDLYDERYALLVQKLEKFKELAAGDPGLEAIAQDLEGAITALGGQVYNRQLSLGMDPGTADQAAEIERSGEGWPFLEKVLKTVDAATALQGDKLAAAETERLAQFAAQSQITIIGVLAALALAIIAAVIPGRQIAPPIKLITSLMEEMSAGDLNVEIPETDRRDEIGDIAKALEIFRDNLQQTEALRMEAADRQKKELDRADALRDLATSFDATVRGLTGELETAAQGLERTSSSMNHVASDTKVRAESLAVASDATSANVQTVSSATTELSASIAEIANQITRASSAAQACVNEADNTANQMSTLQSMADKIGAIVTLIQDVSTQTNLLALNATIEAARAGEAGKGFAVVANEVKGLASQTNTATEDISEQIRGVQEQIAVSVSSLHQMKSQVEVLGETTEAVAAAVEQQNAATRDISENVNDVADGTQKVNENVSYMANVAQETGNLAQQVFDSSALVTRQAKGLSERVDEFLRNVKTVS